MYVGMRVTIGDLKSRPELNGTVGTALSFEQSRSRYAVQIASGERIALKATNLSLAPDEPEAEPTPEDDGAELLECARYGEEDELRQLLAKGVPPGFADAQGTTALHRAAANGHLACVRALAAAGCPHVANSSGNVPLHWAVQQGHVGVTRALLELYSDIDVLAQNEFGKSISSEAFAKGDPALVELLLEHASAAKLEPSGASDGAGAGADGAGTATMEGEATHGFRFLDDAESALVHVRELGELGADDPSQANARILGAGADDDRTGLQLWAASIVLARWLCAPRPRAPGCAPRRRLRALPSHRIALHRVPSAVTLRRVRPPVSSHRIASRLPSQRAAHAAFARPRRRRARCGLRPVRHHCRQAMRRDARHDHRPERAHDGESGAQSRPQRARAAARLRCHPRLA
jgi:hypothetical protein